VPYGNLIVRRGEGFVKMGQQIAGQRRIGIVPGGKRQGY
jgi:hypothetical protein